MPNVDYTLEKFTDSRKPGEKISKARQTAYDLMSFLFKVRQNIHIRETNEGKNVADLRTEIDSLMALMKTYWQTASVADKQQYQLNLNTKKRLLSSAETKRSLASNAYYILLELTYELTELYNDARYREIIKCISKKRLSKINLDGDLEDIYEIIKTFKERLQKMANHNDAVRSIYEQWAAAQEAEATSANNAAEESLDSWFAALNSDGENATDIDSKKKGNNKSNPNRS